MRQLMGFGLAAAVLFVGVEARAAAFSETFDLDTTQADFAATYPYLTDFTNVGVLTGRVENGVLKLSQSFAFINVYELVYVTASHASGGQRSVFANPGESYTVSADLGTSGGVALNYSAGLVIGSNLFVEFGRSNASGQEYFRVIALDFSSNQASTGGIPVQVVDIGFDIISDAMYHVTATVQRHLDSSVTLNVSVADANSDAVFVMPTLNLSAADADLLFKSYDQVGFVQRGFNGTALFDNLKVTFVPEPTSGVLIALAAMGLLRRSRHASLS